MKLYLDVCVLNRILDDQSDNRIRLETEAVKTILMQIIDGHLDLVGSDIINFEISKTPDFERRSITERLSMLSTEFVKTTNEIIERAKKIQNLGINAFDALHISCAEFSRADFFLTTDNSLIKTCNKNNKHLIIKVMNPVNWIMEEF